MVGRIGQLDAPPKLIIKWKLRSELLITLRVVHDGELVQIVPS